MGPSRAGRPANGTINPRALTGGIGWYNANIGSPPPHAPPDSLATMTLVPASTFDPQPPARSSAGRSRFWAEQSPSWLHLRVLMPGAIILIGIGVAGLVTRNTLNGVSAHFDGSRVQVQLLDRHGVLYGEALYGSRLTGRRVSAPLATLSDEAAKLPSIPAVAIRRARVVVEHDPDLVRFVLWERRQEITYDGSRFRLVAAADQP